MGKVRILGVIPARLESTRLARKVLREIAGRPMLEWVYEAARGCRELDEVVIATDAAEVETLCRARGWPVAMTSSALLSGSDRVHAVAQIYPAEIYVNIQGDEPLLRPEHISDLLRPFADAQMEVTTLKVRCGAEDLANPHAVKVVTAHDGHALYFSRATIPFDREGVGAPVWKHLGLYGYRAAALERFYALAPSALAQTLEQTERLEQVRFLENGMRVHVEATEYDTIGVDTEEDLQRAERLLLARQGR